MPVFHVFANRVLAAIAEARPRSHEDLLSVPGVGLAKIERYDEVLAVVAGAQVSLCRLPDSRLRRPVVAGGRMVAAAWSSLSSST